MDDGTALADALLGLPGFRVLEVSEMPEEVVVRVETTAAMVGCGACGTRAVAHERRETQVRDLPCFGRPSRLVWAKRRWRCPNLDCSTETWTEISEHLDAQVVLTRRAGAETCRRVGEHAEPVAAVAAELGVCWWTVMGAVVEHGTPLVDDPDRVGPVTQLGVDETSFLRANRSHSTIYATGLVDLEAHRVIDMTLGNAAADLRRWTAGADPGWLAGVEVAATDLTDSYAAGLSPHLTHVQRVADAFHVVRLANRCIDQVRRRAQQQVRGHRGRKVDPLYRIRKLLLTADERLDERGRRRLALGLRAGDPDGEVQAAWVAKESVSDVYLAADRDEAHTLLAVAAWRCEHSPVPEVRTLGRTLRKWFGPILARVDTGASTDPLKA